MQDAASTDSDGDVVPAQPQYPVMPVFGQGISLSGRRGKLRQVQVPVVPSSAAVSSPNSRIPGTA